VAIMGATLFSCAGGGIFGDLPGTQSD